MGSLLTDSVFWIGVATLVVGGYKFTVSYCLKSRCENFNCLWGLLKIKRDIKGEIEIARIEKTDVGRSSGDLIDLELGDGELKSIEGSMTAKSPVIPNRVLERFPVK